MQACAHRLLSCTFLHAGVLHLGLNCLALYNIGPDVEAVFGYASFCTIYILAGLAGSTASFLFSDLVTVGASGAIFGLLGESPCSLDT
jgi:rhomboid protease GluP